MSTNNIKKTSKAKVIAKAFFEGADTPKDIHDYRMSICQDCSYNSLNIDMSDLNIFNQVRKLSNPNVAFCTHCTCFLKKKTGQRMEQCDLPNPKWFRLAVTTESKTNFDLINLSFKDVNVSADKEDYIVYIGDIDNDKEFNFSLSLDFKETTVSKLELTPSCPLCTSLYLHNSDDNKQRIDISLMNLSPGEIDKKISVNYSIDGNSYKSIIKINGRTI